MGVSDPSPEHDRLLALIADHILEHGVSELTLRALARSVGSNNRMLLYYFGSKERLMADGILAAQRRFPRIAGAFDELKAASAPLGERLHRAWLQIAAEENMPFIRLFFELFGLAAHQPERYGGFLAAVGTDWVDQLAAALRRDDVPAPTALELATEVVALWRGLQFALISGGDRETVTRTHAAAAHMIGIRAGRATERV